MGTFGVFSSYSRDVSSKLVLVQRRQESCLVMRDTSGISLRPGRAIQMLLVVRRETQGPFPVVTGILEFLSIFKSQASSHFEAFNSTCLSKFQRDVRPPVQMRLGTRALSRISTGDSDISSSCEMKEEPAFKPLQGNPAFIRVRAFHLRQQTQVPSHIPIAEGSLLLSCLWKVGIPLQMKPGNQLSSRNDMWCPELSSSSRAELGVPLD